MNVDGAFILAETRRNQEDLSASFIDSIFINESNEWEDVCRAYHIGTCL